ncbi:MAG: tetratricopeptide repeat protein [Congregibacter sp.]
MNWAFDVRDIPPLKHAEGIYTYQDSLNLDRPDVLAVSPEMQDFVLEYTEHSNNPRTSLMALHQAVKSPGILAMQYDPLGDGVAQEAFERRSANCLSYAHMFVALAREAGLNARYQWMAVRPEWHRIGERVALRLHVNVMVKMRDGTEYMVDIDPLTSHQVAGARIMDDSEALALHHNNLAMQALADERPELAWLQLVRGLEIAPGLSQLWVNLGAIYRYTDQYAEAEQAYLHALEVDKGDRSAMNNLAVLYELEGRLEEQAYWLDRMHRYRERNPYYHANLGEMAMATEDWDLAYEHYRTARKLQPRDSLLLYNLGLVQHRRGNDKEAERLISLAIERAPFLVDKVKYRAELRSIREELATSL